MKKVWDAIFDYAGYTYSGSFFNEPFLDDVYLLCNNSLKYPEFSSVNLETYGKIKVGAISGSGMTDKVLVADTFTTLPWYNALSDPQNFYNNGAYEVKERTNLSGILNININVNCPTNNMPGTLSANGTWQIRMIETGSSTPYSLRAIQSYIFFFDQLQNSRTGSIDTTYQLQTEFLMDDIPPGNYYFQIKQRPNSAVDTAPTVTLDPKGTTKSFLQITEVKQAADGRVMDIMNNMPFGTTGIKLIDFIKGIQKKFNLVIYPSKTKRNEFVVETFNTWYKSGEIKDFNKYINLDEKIEVTPANNLAVNELNFGDSLDQDYVSQQFSKLANREYGKTYYVDTQNFFSQGKFEVKTSLASSPLLQISGTGLSGSIEGLQPAQPYKLVNQFTKFLTGNYGNICDDYSEFSAYTDTGTILPDKFIYLDPYGNSVVTGFRYVVNPSTNEAFNLDAVTGEIGTGTGVVC
jgi:hypothetical protein